MIPRPSLDGVVDALLVTDARLPQVGPTPEEADAAEAVRFIAETHRGGPTCDDPEVPPLARRWGVCSECSEPWPCSQWAYAQSVAIQYLGRAADRYVARRASRASWKETA